MPSWGRAGFEVALFLTGPPEPMVVTGRTSRAPIDCCPQPSYTLLASLRGAHLRWRVRDRWCCSGCQPSWIRAELAIVESNCQELWQD